MKWACPKCGAPSNGHGKGGGGSCINGRGTTCEGFVCECPSDGSGTHGTHEDPCLEANCYHCGWGGEFPPPGFDPKKLKGWAKTAFAAGWKPPIGWTP